jgi:hypothetical protein
MHFQQTCFLLQLQPSHFYTTHNKTKCSKTTKKRMFKHEEKDFEEVQQAPPSDYSSNYVDKLRSDSAVCFYDQSSYSPQSDTVN